MLQLYGPHLQWNQAKQRTVLPRNIELKTLLLRIAISQKKDLGQLSQQLEMNTSQKKIKSKAETGLVGCQHSDRNTQVAAGISGEFWLCLRSGNNLLDETATNSFKENIQAMLRSLAPLWMNVFRVGETQLKQTKTMPRKYISLSKSSCLCEYF